MKQTFVVGAFAIILDGQNRVLLCHRLDHDLWNLPGGKLEAGESPWNGVIREVKEEVGLDVKVDHVSGIYYKPEKNEIVFSFICKITGGEITTSNEADQIDYFAVGEIPNNTVPKQVERIKDALAEKNKTQMKVQVGTSSIDLVKQGRL